MASQLTTSTVSRQRVIGESRPAMLKADLPKREKDRSLLIAIGFCLDEARRAVGWTVDRLARELQRDEKQVARWIRGEERTQVDVVFSVPELKQPFVIALARLAECVVDTVITVRRRA